MTKIGFYLPQNSDHAIRGIGTYSRLLLENLEMISSKRGLSIQPFSDPDLIKEFALVHYPFLDLFQPTLPLIKKTPTLITVHDVIPLEFPQVYKQGFKAKIYLNRQMMALKSCKFVITDSFASVNSIHKFLHVEHSRIKLIYLASSNKFFPVNDRNKLLPIRKKYKLPEKFILYVGDVNWNKNLPGLISATQKMGFPLVLVGKNIAQIESLNLNHPELMHLKEVVSSLKSNKIIRLGFVPDDDLNCIFNMASVYCQASFAEGFGIPVLDALTCAVPVACSRTHSLPEVAGSAAAYFNPYDIGSICEAINQAPQIPVSVRLAQAGRFSWSATASQTLQVYEQCLASN